MPEPIFHLIVSEWFARRFNEPSEPQRRGWPIIQSGGNVLIAAPTGSGKTLAAFLCAIDQLVKEGLAGGLRESTRVLYISPLKALANDVRQNLLQPLQEIRESAVQSGIDLPEIRPLVRSGDTTARERRTMVRHPPHILVTTPESFFILLTSASGRDILGDVRTVIVDEIHALAPSKRGSHLALSLERLEALTRRPLQRIGLSATQRPIEKVARFLGGVGRDVAIIDAGHRRQMDLAVEVPRDELGAVASEETWQEVYDRLAELIRQHRTTLVFVNTRRLAERATHHLVERLGKEAVATHHGSLSREVRLETEKRLKRGELRAVVATASLELGIDIGAVDLVCQVGSTRSIALALQRIGRSGHLPAAVGDSRSAPLPKGRFFVTSRDDLLECAALVRSIRQGRLDRLLIPEAPLDVLAQQIVAAAASRTWPEDDLFGIFRKASPYADLSRSDFDSLVTILSEGFARREGRRRAYLHRDGVNGAIRARRGARLAALTSGGAIPDNATFLVKLDPDEVVVGTVDEEFAVESMRGDIFLLGNASWRIRRIENGVLRVEDAQGAPPNFPFWRGEAPGRTAELSRAFSDLRVEIGHRTFSEAIRWLQKECGLDRRGAEQAALYVQAGKSALGVMPSQDCIVAERFFDEAGGMQLVIHSPFGSRLNKAWGLALRKRFCRSFNFELQAAATENGIVLSLSDQHSFPLDSVFSFLDSGTVQDVLVQALLASPLFTTRWRWNASRALAVLRMSGGKRVPPFLQRMRSDDLLAAVFPEQAACLENIEGDIAVPDHPLVNQTILDSLTEAMDIDGLMAVLQKIENGEIRCVAIDTREPSPFSHEILNGNLYSFLDNAPLEERRARAVQTRRTLLPRDASDLGTLDAAAILQVAGEAWPPMRDVDEAHDALLTLGVLPDTETRDAEGDRRAFFQDLEAGGRAFRFSAGPEPRAFWAATERRAMVSRVYPFVDEISLSTPDPTIVQELVRNRLESTGPTTVLELSEVLQLPTGAVDSALHALEAEGLVLRGAFRPSADGLEWCDRRLLARIHRLTLGRLRKEIEPVTPADFMRFLLGWQHLAPGTQLYGESGLSLVLEQLQGFEAPSAAWETFLLSRRVANYSPALLDHLCLSGQFTWARLTAPSSADAVDGEVQSRRSLRPTRLAPVAFFRRADMAAYLRWREQLLGPREDASQRIGERLSGSAAEVLDALQRWGALFVEDLVVATGRLPVEVEEGLWELVAAGLVTSDSFDNLRTLIDPRRRRGTSRSARPGQRKLRRKPAEQARGRWTRIFQPLHGPAGHRRTPDLEPFARQLLARWGIVFRDLLAREALAPAWRDLLMIYRRLEARGEIRGGRFVGGFVGEQFALPGAVDSLRTVRRTPRDGTVVRVSAADPLNLVGIVTPGARVRPHPENFMDFRDGVPDQDQQGLRRFNAQALKV